MRESLTLPVVDCWNTIGVKGDRSCDKLPAAIHCHNCPVFAEAARAFLDREAPPGYLQEVTEGLSRAAPARTSETVSVVVFEVGDQLLAIDTQAVVEVTAPRTPHRVGHRTGRIFSGLVNIHGQLELCCSLHGLLQIEVGATRAPAAHARMLLVEHEGQRFSFEVAAVHGVHRFGTADSSAVPATSQQDAASYVRQLLRFGERRVGHLDLAKTFRALEASLK
ncbi:MAG: CheW-like domain protein [Polyangiaceae bacterium]|jgi:chemotaxis-related protein WspD|nr:CheW-like domain protein [Polyangiaceae bacterium]